MSRFCAFLLIVFTLSSCKQRTRDISHVTEFSDLFKQTYRSEIERFVPDDYEVLGIDSAFINNDSLIDFVVALKYIDEKPLYNEVGNEPIRPVLIIFSYLDSLILVSRCDSSLYAFYMGGMVDPFESVTIDSDGVIKIINSGGSSHNRWEVISKFQYDSVENNLYLHEYYSRGYFDDDNQTTVNETHLTPKDFYPFPSGARV